MDVFVNRSSHARVPWKKCIQLLALSGVLLVGTIFPRLMLLGGLPATDEGYYAYQAQMIHQSLAMHGGLPATGTLALYPMLVSWVFALPINPMIMLRLVDLCVAAVAAFLLYRVLTRVSASHTAGAVLTLIFTFTMNQPIFIQYGFKNSIAAAFVPLLLAMRVGQEGHRDYLRAWWTAGVLTALAVLLRETFVPFALLGASAVLVTQGRRAALHFTLGVSLTIALIIGAVALSRGDFLELIAAYRNAGTVYASIAHQSRDLFISNGTASVNASVTALALSAGSAIFLFGIAWRDRDRNLLLRTVFWLLASFLPLIEPMSKIGFPYHFAVSLIGLSGLCALAWRALSERSSAGQWGIYMIGVVAVVSLAGKAAAPLDHWSETRNTLAAFPSGSWPAEAVPRSNYLIAAETIKKFIRPNGTVSVSGFMFALYPLTGHFPPSPALANLSATLIQLDLSPDRLRDVLLRCPPDVIMTTTRTDWDGQVELLAAVTATGLYEQVADIPVSLERHYGSFGGVIFRTKEPQPCAPIVEAAWSR